MGTKPLTEVRKVGRMGKVGERKEKRRKECVDSGRGNLWVINAAAEKTVPLLKQNCSWQRKL